MFIVLLSSRIHTLLDFSVKTEPDSGDITENSIKSEPQSAEERKKQLEDLQNEIR